MAASHENLSQAGRLQLAMVAQVKKGAVNAAPRGEDSAPA